jgi:hypothetical protein
MLHSPAPLQAGHSGKDLPLRQNRIRWNQLHNCRIEIAEDAMNRVSTKKTSENAE